MPELSSVAAFGSINVQLQDPDYTRLDAVISLALKVLVSDAPGADEQIQRFLADRGYTEVVVYHNGRGPAGRPRRNLGDWPEVLVDGSYTAKDVRMCSDADAGLAFWNGRSTGTGRNVAQLRREGKPVRLVVRSG
jgi:hypothetical protein